MNERQATAAIGKTRAETGRVRVRAKDSGGPGDRRPDRTAGLTLGPRIARLARLVLLVAPLLALPDGSLAEAQSREEKVRADRKKVEAEGFWIYNDLARGFAEAKRTGKPLLVVLRCIPCEECVKLDDELVDRDPVLRPLMEKFVCVRQVSTNGLDLATFQFDTDQSFAVFLLNADGAIYGRFGTRSHRTQWDGDVSLDGLAKALRGALDLHADYPRNRESLAGKRGPAPEFASPEKFPSLQGKYQATLAAQGAIVPSCIHCHQIGDAERDLARERKQPLPDERLFPFPHPTTIGLTLDPEEQASTTAVAAGSAAERAGLRAGDQIERMAGQPLLSIADLQWVLHRTPATGGRIPVVVRRGEQRVELTLTLDDGWRRAGDLSWRASTWGLRRMATGGLVLEPASADQRAKLELPPEAMALLVKYAGEYGPHAAGKQAGFRKGDVIVEFDGRTDLRRESDLLRHGLQQRRVGERVEVKVWRDGRTETFKLPMQP